MRGSVLRPIVPGALGLALLAPAVPARAAAPELPRAYVDTTYVPPTGVVLAVPAGGNLQAALDAALPGDVISLQAGATFTGPFRLRAKSGSGWIIVRTSAPDANLPAPGSRITPAYAPLLPKIVSTSSEPAFLTDPGAHHYRFIGVEFTVTPPVTLNYGLVQLGDGSGAQNTLAEVPHHLILDRVYVHGNATVNLRRGVGLNSAWTAVIDSHISDVHEQGADSQAIGGWNGPGPFKIVNNYLEGAGENVLLGGADPKIPDLVPSDVEVRRNHFFKPLSWRIGDPSYAGRPWTVKNLFELKNARRVLVEGNVFENNWLHAQNGFGILFTVRNQDGSAPWSVVEDVTFRWNVVRHVAAGVNILGIDNNYPSQRTRRILLKDNLFEDVDGARWGGSGRLVQILDGPADVAIDHNTAFQTAEIVMAAGGASTGFTFQNNLVPVNLYGVAGDGTFGNPLATLATYFPGALFAKNALVGGSAGSYPIGNYFPGAWAEVRFVSHSAADYRLASDSPYKGAGTDGKDLGADIDAIQAAIAGGAPPPPPPGDTTPPSVTLTAPAPGSSLSGIVSISATASDNVGVVGVRFLVDGAGLGAEDATAPYSVSWDTRTVANGTHTLTAVARDAAGNSASAAVTVPVANTTQSPYRGQPFALPGGIPAEDFDRGGEGVAYHDRVPGNQGGAYRPAENVDIISPYAGGYAVNNFETGEWLEYTVSVAQTGSYRLEALVSSELTTARLRMEVDGVDVTGTLGVPRTTNWRTFQWVGKSGVTLTAGTHVLRLYAVAQYFNLDSLRATREPGQVTWTQTVNVAASVGRLQKTAGCEGCADAGAVSVQAIASGNGRLEVTASETTTHRWIGLSRGNSSTGGADIDFALQFWPAGTVDVRESGVYRNAETSYAPGDVFRIAVEVGRVKYYKNGALFYTSSVVPAYPLQVDTALVTVGATLQQVVLRTAP